METVKEVKTVKFQLETPTCPSFIAKIEGALSKEKEVEEVKVFFNASKVKVKYNEERVSSEKLGEIIEEVGFPILSS